MYILSTSLKIFYSSQSLASGKTLHFFSCLNEPKFWRFSNKMGAIDWVEWAHFKHDFQDESYRSSIAIIPFYNPEQSKTNINSVSCVSLKWVLGLKFLVSADGLNRVTTSYIESYAQTSNRRVIYHNPSDIQADRSEIKQLLNEVFVIS